MSLLVDHPHLRLLIQHRGLALEESGSVLALLVVIIVFHLYLYLLYFSCDKSFLLRHGLNRLACALCSGRFPGLSSCLITFCGLLPAQTQITVHLDLRMLEYEDA